MLKKQGRHDNTSWHLYQRIRDHGDMYVLELFDNNGQNSKHK